MPARFQVPRFRDNLHFAIREGEHRTWWGWIVKEQIGVDNSSEVFSYAGQCRLCVIWGGNALCRMQIATYWDNADKRHFHCGLIWEEAAAGSLLDDTDTFTATLDGTSSTIDYLGGSTDLWCRPCAGGDNTLQSIDPAPRVAARNITPGQTNSAEMSEFAWSKADFRDFWNGLVPLGSQVGSDEACPIEPSGDRFRFWKCKLSERTSPVSHTGTGYCHPYGAANEADCQAAAACSTWPSGPGVAWMNITSQFTHNDPSISVPLFFKADGAEMDRYPGGLGSIAYWDANAM